MKNEKYYCYILRCADNTLYTGFTVDLERRVLEHNEGKKGAKYTMSRRPCELVYSELFDTKEEAMKREYFIKHKMTKKEKELLIAKDN